MTFTNAEFKSLSTPLDFPERFSFSQSMFHLFGIGIQNTPPVLLGISFDFDWNDEDFTISFNVISMVTDK